MRLTDPFERCGQTAGDEDSPILRECGRSPFFVTGFPPSSARTNGLHRHHPECELFVKASRSRGLHPVATDKLPADLAHSPLDEPGLRVPRSAVLARSGGRVVAPSGQGRFEDVFRIERRSVPGARQRSTLDWVRGELSELELGVAPGLQLISVGPPEVVESSHLSDEIVSARCQRARMRLCARSGFV